MQVYNMFYSNIMRHEKFLTDELGNFPSNGKTVKTFDAIWPLTELVEEKTVHYKDFAP